MHHMKNRRKSRASTAQLERLVKFMEDNPAAVSGKLTATFTKADKDRLWTALVEELNAMGKEAKTLDKWKKTWIDFKSNCRERAKCVRKQALNPPNEKWQIRKMGELEERVAVLLERTEPNFMSAETISQLQAEVIERLKKDTTSAAASVLSSSATSTGSTIQVPLDWSTMASLPGFTLIQVAETPAQREEETLIIPGNVQEMPMDDENEGDEMPVVVKVEVLSAPPSPEQVKEEALETLQTVQNDQITNSPNKTDSSTIRVTTDQENQQFENQNENFQIGQQEQTSTPDSFQSAQASFSGVVNQSVTLQTNNSQANTQGAENSVILGKVPCSRTRRKRTYSHDMVQVQRETNEILRNQTEAFKEMTNAFNRIADAIYSLSVNRN